MSTTITTTDYQPEINLEDLDLVQQVVFQDVGVVAESASFGHITNIITTDDDLQIQAIYDKFKQQILSLANVTDSHPFLSTDEQLHQLSLHWDQVRTLYSGTSFDPVDKRAIFTTAIIAGAIAGGLTSAVMTGTGFGINSAITPTGLTQEQGTFIVNNIQNLTTDIITIRRLLNQISVAQHNTRLRQDVETHMAPHFLKLRRKLTGLDAMTRGTLTSDLIQPAQAASSLRKLMKHARGKGFTIPKEALHFFYTLPFTFKYFPQDGTITLVVHVPIVVYGQNRFWQI